MGKLMLFKVEGTPVPKQSFRYDGNGRGHIAPRIKAWQEMVSIKAKQAAIEQYWKYQEKAPLDVIMIFSLPDRRRRDLDNLSKAVLDGLKGIVFSDDSQVHLLYLHKNYTTPTGVEVLIELSDSEEWDL